MKPLKIIVFDGSFRTTPFINRLAAGLAANHDIYILGFNEKLPNKNDAIHYIALGSNQNKFRLAITSLAWVFRARKLQLLFSTLKKMFQGNRQIIQQQNLELVLKKISPDIIHLQWPSVISWFEEVLLEQKIPIVLSQRGTHSNIIPFVNKQNFEYLEKWYPKIAGFHSVSKAISANGDKIWNSPNKIDEVVYTGIPLNAIAFSNVYTQHYPLKLLSIGRPHWVKGYNYMLQSCAILKEKGIPFKYTIVGAANNEELQFIVNDLGLTDSVFLTKKITQEEVFEVMETSSVLILPSIEEGIANVVVEAMAIGLPVISSDCGGMREVVEHKKQGWVVSIRNPIEMAGAVITFINTPINEIEKIRLAARRKVEMQFTKEKMISDMESLYKTVSINFIK